MAIIPQQTLFVWGDIENLGDLERDLERLRLVLEYMPDEELMRILEKERGKGRDDFPVRAMWNSVLESKTGRCGYAPYYARRKPEFSQYFEENLS